MNLKTLRNAVVGRISAPMRVDPHVEGDPGDVDGDFEEAGFWKIRKAPSNIAKCMKCKSNIEPGSWRMELVALKAVVSTQDGRGIAEIKRAHCFFGWLGVGRRATTKGLRRLGDLEDIESVGEADKLQFQQQVSRANSYTQKSPAVNCFKP